MLAALFLALALAFQQPAPLDITVLYDNTAAQAGVEADWGFAALVEFRGHTILFDSGANPGVLLRNMKALKVDPARIEAAVISHEHADHLGGLNGVLARNRSMRVYFLDAFRKDIFDSVRVKPQRIAGPVEIAPGVFSTGMVEGMVPEQALAIETAGGLVIVTGCSHPGVVKMVDAAMRQRGAERVRFLLGGFHMLTDPPARAAETIKSLRAAGVESVSATHCTGETTIKLFREAYGAKFESAGVGRRFHLE